jgi:hypothetical protein
MIYLGISVLMGLKDEYLKVGSHLFALLTLSIPGSRHVEKRRYFVEAKYIL